MAVLSCAFLTLRASDLSFETGYDARLRSGFICENYLPYERRQITIDEIAAGRIYAGLIYGDINLELSPIIDQRLGYSHVVPFDSKKYSSEPKELLWVKRYRSGVDLCMSYLNSKDGNGWIKLEEVDFGKKRPVWSEAAYFTGLDILNYAKDFYYMDDFRDGGFGCLFKTSFFDRAFYLEFFGAAQGLENRNRYAYKLSSDIGNLSFSIYNGCYIVFDPSGNTGTAIQSNGFGITYKVGGNSKIYLEGIFPEIDSWKFPITPVLGVAFTGPENVSVTAEINYTGRSVDSFLQAIYSKPFGWQGWEAVLSGKYFPETDNNLAVLFGVRNTVGPFQCEFRYGYESLGNHRVDVNLRLAQDFNIMLLKDEDNAAK